MPTPDISSALDRITLRMISELELDELLRTITEGLVEDLPVASASIWLLETADGDGEEDGDKPAFLRRAAGAGIAPPEGTAAPSKIDWIVAERDHFCTNSVPTDGSAGAAPWLLENGLRALGGFPLTFRDEVLGAMAVYSRQTFDMAVFERLFVFARQAAVAIKNARLFTHVERLRERLSQENQYLRTETESGLGCGDIVGTSPAMRSVLEQIDRVAPTDSTVLVGGETGTGKELVAKAIHERSRRAAGPLVKVNCGAISAGLVESELFGHEKGAFTGAVDRRVGRFELADGGTLFLDEIGELPPETQVKLLRVLQEQEFERVGSSQPIRVDVRIVAATHRDLAQDVEAGRFRADLYYRLQVFPIHLPALQERLGDVPLIAGCVLPRIAERIGKHFDGLSEAAVERLMSYAWPGNVRELLNVLERAAILSPEPLLEVDAAFAAAPTIPSASSATSATEEPVLTTLAEVERRHIGRVLEHVGGRIEGPKGAAKILGMHPNTLRSRMQKHGIER